MGIYNIDRFQVLGFRVIRGFGRFVFGSVRFDSRPVHVRIVFGAPWLSGAVVSGRASVRFALVASEGHGCSEQPRCRCRWISVRSIGRAVEAGAAVREWAPRLPPHRPS